MKENKAMIIVTGREGSGRSEAAQMCLRRYGLTYAEGISPEKKDIYVLEPSDAERCRNEYGGSSRVITVCLVPSLDMGEIRGKKARPQEYREYLRLRESADYIFSNSTPEDLRAISEALAFLVKHG